MFALFKEKPCTVVHPRPSLGPLFQKSEIKFSVLWSREVPVFASLLLEPEVEHTKPGEVVSFPVGFSGMGDIAASIKFPEAGRVFFVDLRIEIGSSDVYERYL